MIIEERLKHRIMGFAVILSVAIILTPAIIKKSNQRIEHMMHVSVHLPEKPLMVEATPIREAALFQKIEKSHTVVPDGSSGKAISILTKAEPLAPSTALTGTTKPTILALADESDWNNVATTTDHIVQKQSVSQSALKTSVKPVYALQVASFSKLENAAHLVGVLQKEGYAAQYQITSGAQGKIYRVLVGASPQREEILRVQKRLASAMQLRGFIVTTELA
ncbi:MAG: SPOR domain-containing protein [Legionellaceae bacterium]|nr:SPOR domain-containing protein [Legionellaceae bacterium]